MSLRRRLSSSSSASDICRRQVRAGRDTPAAELSIGPGRRPIGRVGAAGGARRHRQLVVTETTSRLSAGRRISKSDCEFVLIFSSTDQVSLHARQPEVEIWRPPPPTRCMSTDCLRRRRHPGSTTKCCAPWRSTSPYTKRRHRRISIRIRTTISSRAPRWSPDTRTDKLPTAWRSVTTCTTSGSADFRPRRRSTIQTWWGRRRGQPTASRIIGLVRSTSSRMWSRRRSRRRWTVRRRSDIIRGCSSIEVRRPAGRRSTCRSRSRNPPRRRRPSTRASSTATTITRTMPRTSTRRSITRRPPAPPPPPPSTPGAAIRSSEPPIRASADLADRRRAIRCPTRTPRPRTISNSSPSSSNSAGSSSDSPRPTSDSLWEPSTVTSFRRQRSAASKRSSSASRTCASWNRCWQSGSKRPIPRAVRRPTSTRSQRRHEPLHAQLYFTTKLCTQKNIHIYVFTKRQCLEICFQAVRWPRSFVRPFVCPDRSCYTIISHERLVQSRY